MKKLSYILQLEFPLILILTQKLKLKDFFGVNADDPVDRKVSLSQLLTNHALKLWIFENKTHFCAVEGNIALPLEGQMEEA